MYFPRVAANVAKWSSPAVDLCRSLHQVFFQVFDSCLQRMTFPFPRGAELSRDFQASALKMWAAFAEELGKRL